MPQRRTFILAVLVLLFGAGALIVVQRLREPWRCEEIEAIVVRDALDARRVRLSRGGEAIYATILRLKQDRIFARLVDVGEGQTLNDVAGDATVAINGGYFDATFAPLGLYRVEGRNVMPTLDRPPLSGVVTIDHAGRLDVGAPDKPSAPSAFQAGPFLIDPGGAIGIRGDDGKRAERTVLACGDGFVVVIVTTPATLRALAECLHDRPQAFGLTYVDRALNLDGGPSTGLVLNTGDRRFVSPPRGRIRTVVTVRCD